MGIRREYLFNRDRENDSKLSDDHGEWVYGNKIKIDPTASLTPKEDVFSMLFHFAYSSILETSFTT